MRFGLKRVLAVWALALVIFGGEEAWRFSQRYAFGINETDSLPNWAFVVDRQDHAPRRGELVTFIAPDNPYYPRGARFTKIAWGAPGDVVTRVGREYFVNGRSGGVSKPFSQTGRATTLGPTGVIPPGRFYVGTPHKDSLDSRYGEIGWIGAERIVGVARPVM